MCAMFGRKTYSLILLIGMLFTTADGAVTGYSNLPESYLTEPHDMSRWSIGVMAQNAQREIEIEISGLESIKIHHYYFRVGYELADWITLLGSIGLSEFAPETSGDFDSTDTAWSVGAAFRLLEHWILGIRRYEDRFSIDASVQYTSLEGEFRNRDMELQELAASVTLSFINELETDKWILLDEIRLFMGPIYSDIEGTVATATERAVDEEDKVGFVAGLDLLLNRHTSFIWEIQIFEEKLSHGGGIIFNF
jgi:hypothetical protein